MSFFCFVLSLIALQSTNTLAATYPTITATNAEQVDQIEQFGIGGGATTQTVWSPDGQFIFVSHLAGAWVYNISNLAKPLYTLPSTAIQTTFSHDSKFIAVALSESTKLQFYEVKTGKLNQQIDMGARIAKFEFSPDGRLVVASLNEHPDSIKVWNLKTNTLVIEHEAAIYMPIPLVFSPDGSVLIFKSRTVKAEVDVLDINKKQVVARLKFSERERINAENIVFSADGKLLAIDDQTGGISLWETSNWQKPEQLPTLPKSDIWEPGIDSLQFSRDGTLLVVGGGGALTLFDIRTRQQRLQINIGYAQVTSVSFTQDGAAFITSNTDHTLRFYESATGKEIVTLDNHYNEVRYASFNPAKTMIASAGDDGYVRLWAVVNQPRRVPATFTRTSRHNFAKITRQNANRLKQVDVLGRGMITAVAWSPDDKTLGVSTVNGVWLYSMASFSKAPRVLGYGQRFIDFAFSPDGKLLAAADSDSTIRIWEVVSGKPYGVWKRHTASVTSLEFSKDGTLLISGGGGPDASLRIWDVKTGQQILALQLCCSGIADVAISPDKKTLAAVVPARYFGSGSEGHIYTFDATTGTPGKRMKRIGSVQRASFLPDGKLLTMTGYFGETVQVWDTQTDPNDTELNPVLKEYIAGEAEYFASLAISSDGTIAAFGDTEIGRGHPDKRFDVLLWDIAKNTSIGRLPGHVDEVREVAFNHASTLLAAAAGDGSLHLWDLSTQKELTILAVSDTTYLNRITIDSNSSTVSASYFSNGDRYADACYSTHPQIWNLAQRKRIPFTAYQEQIIVDWALTSRGRMLIGLGCDGTINTWNIASEELIDAKPSVEFSAYSIGLSQNQKILVIAGFQNQSSSGQLEIYDYITKKRLTSLSFKDQIIDFALTSDGSRLVVQHGSNAGTGENYQYTEVFNTTTGVSIKTVDQANGFFRSKVAAISPDGRLIAVNGANGPEFCTNTECDIQVWSVDDDELVGHYWGHLADVNSLSFNSDGTLLASSAFDGTVRVFDIKTAGELAVLRHSGVRTVAFTPDGKLLVSAGSDGTIRLWAVQ